MALLRTLAIVLIAAAVFHLLMYLWLRSLHRERLEQAWQAGRAPTLTRERFIVDGMEAFRRSVVVRLLWLIYPLPLVALGTVIYINNHL